MICDYHMSLRGRSHEKNGKPCQDCSSSFGLDDCISVAIIADGVGSCKHADIASATAVEAVASTVKQLSSIEDRIGVMRKAFSEAKIAIEKVAEKNNEPVTDYDTTLTAVIYDGDRICYGHSGDGGIIGLKENGEYVKVTEPLKGEDGVSVLPLRFDTTWRFGECEGLVSVLLATDGVYDNFFPYLIRYNEPPILVNLAEYFMNNNDLSITPENRDEICEETKQFLLSDSCATIQDDMTVAVLINNERNPKRMKDAYYAEPDWEGLEKKWKEKAYKPIPEPVYIPDPNVRITTIRGPEAYIGLWRIKYKQRKKRKH